MQGFGFPYLIDPRLENSSRSMVLLISYTAIFAMVMVYASMNLLYKRERDHAFEKMKFQALHDPLTSLANRSHFDRYLSALFGEDNRRKPGELTAFFYIDLDGFKEINDCFGHDAGDHLLVTIGQRLKEAIRDNDLTARLGGDEFVIIACDLNQQSDVDIIAENLLAKINQPCSYQGKKLEITASIGASVYPTQSTDIDSLKKMADSAMYKAKKNGAGWQLAEPLEA